jgi:N,N'-diacetyllegionaminate synthase
VYVSDAGKSNYLAKHGISRDINEIFDHLSMPYEMIPELVKHCKKYNIMFMSTPFSVADAREVDPYVSIHKVASYEINHVRLLEFLAKTKKPIIVSTGASTYAEIDFAVNLMKKNRNYKIALMQCTAKYPAPIESLNLMAIAEIKSRYGLPVGLSDHSTDPIIGPLGAIGVGATLIEKHFTLDRNLPGPDHSFALIPSELELMIKSIRKAEKARGNGQKRILEEEKELKRFATRSLQAIKDIAKGERFQEGYNFDVLRPGNQKRGVDARFLTKIQGKISRRNIKSGQGITLSDV